MAFGFRKSFRIAPGVRVNVGKKGGSVRLGPRGLGVTTGTSGTRVSAGIAGTGVNYSQKIGGKGRAARVCETAGVADLPVQSRGRGRKVLRWLVAIFFAIVVAAWLAGGSRG